MEDKNLFDPILDTNEEIVEIFKPSFLRFVVFPVVFFATLLLICFVPFIIFTILEGIVGLFFLFPFVFGLAIYFPIKYLQYTKTIYCYTNKRILIRTGVIGADYKTLDFDMIGGMNVKVDFLDKLSNPNTGTIVFASSASPIITSNRGISVYSFAAISNPYEVYKRLKEYSSKNKDGNLNS